MAGHVVKWNYGLTENLDLGLQWETLSLGVRAKYAFINNKEGWSLATALGTGIALGGGYYGGDIIGSYMTGAWEPYGTLRIAHVKNDPWELKNKDTGKIEYTIPDSEYDYGQVILGTRYWFTPNWLFSVEASSLFASSVLKVSNGVLAGGSLGYRF